MEQATESFKFRIIKLIHEILNSNIEKNNVSKMEPYVG